MCQTAAADAGEALTTLEPELQPALTLWNVPATEQATIIEEWKEAESLLLTWTPGTAGQNIIEVLTDIDKAITPLIPPTDALIGNILLAAIVGVIGTIEAHQPAPAGTGAAQPNAQGLHIAAVTAKTTATVAQLVPEFKLSRFHSVGHQVKTVTNRRVAKMVAIDPKYKVLELA